MTIVYHRVHTPGAFGVRLNYEVGAMMPMQRILLASMGIGVNEDTRRYPGNIIQWIFRTPKIEIPNRASSTSIETLAS